MARTYSSKKRGAYTETLDQRFYAECPKAVFAALAASPYINNAFNALDLDDDFDLQSRVTSTLAQEWVLLYQQGLVDSKPTKYARQLAAQYLANMRDWWMASRDDLDAPDASILLIADLIIALLPHTADAWMRWYYGESE